MELEVLSQVYRFKQNGMDVLQVNSFYPDRRMVMKTYTLSGEEDVTEDDLLVELEYPVQESKLRALQRRFERDFVFLPEGSSVSPAYLEVSGESVARRYSLHGGNVSAEFQELFEYMTRIVSYSSIPSG